MNTLKTIHALFEEKAKHFPESIAVESEQGSLSYKLLNEKANQLAHYLRALNPRTDIPIALCLERGESFLIAILAILKTGCAYLPIDFTHPDERLQFILEDSDTPILITQKTFQSKFSQYKGHILDVEDTIDYPKNNLDLDIAANNLAYVIYTSGSTGLPKGVLIEHASAINYALWFADYCPAKRMDFSSNPNFDMAITMSIVPLILGLSVIICSEHTKQNLRAYIHYLHDKGIDTIKMTPSYFKVLLTELKHNFIPLPYLKTIILGGEQLSAAECKAWLHFYPSHQLINEYGPTETTVGISIYPINSKNIQNLQENIPIGHCGKNMYCRILDANKNPLAEGESGELYIGGACLARGYLNRPELNEQQFIIDPFSNDRLYKTGDLCRKMDKDNFEYLGRIDNQVKIRGYRIEPAEIEKHLHQHPDIATAIVVAQPGPNNEKRLLAYFITQPNQPIPSANICREFLKKRLPHYMIPEDFYKIDALPLTANGKLDVAALPQFKTAHQPFLAPITDIEKVLTQIWSKELDVPRIGLNDDFFEMGGHSLSAARIISEINAHFKTNITMHNFYQATNIAELAKILQTSTPTEKPEELIIHAHANDIPLSEFQFMLWIMNTFEPETKKLNITARKRFKGKLDVEAIKFAMTAVITKQEALCYQILTLRPTQQVQKPSFFHFNEHTMEDLKEEQCEEILEQSLHELMHFHPWPKDSPLFLLRLFHLNNDISELQITMSHMISDDLSPDILLADLSRNYLLFHNKDKENPLEPDLLYKKYIQEEQHYYQHNLDKDTQFWGEYLKDTELFSFPANYVVRNMKAQQSSYSTYTEIPEQGLKNLKQFCATHQISFNDGLCATMAFVLKNHAQSDDNNIFINRVKSTRENRNYDDTIGCFLRLEPIKININKCSSFKHLSQQIHQSSMETSPYQRCPGLVKLTSTQTFHKKQSKILDFFMNVGTKLYGFVFKVPPIHRKIFNQCSGPLIQFDRKSYYLININVHSNFIEPTPKMSALFGFDTINIAYPQYDLLNIDNCFDVCFIRNDGYNKPYLVISANLQPQVRELIAKEVIEVLTSAA